MSPNIKSPRVIGGPTVIQLRGGGGLDLLTPDPDAIDIRDIARGLATARRFAGQTVRPYSVAEHSVHVSRIVPPEHAMAGLLHDAHEAYTGDLSRTLKMAIERLVGSNVMKLIEQNLDRAIYSRFGVPLPIPAEVKLADNRMLAAERDQAMGGERGVRWAGLPEPADVRLEFWPWEVAEREFLLRYGALASGVGE